MSYVYHLKKNESKPPQKNQCFVNIIRSTHQLASFHLLILYFVGLKNKENISNKK